MEQRNETLARYYSKKKKMKKRKKLFFYTLLVALFIVVVTVLSLTVFFNIDKITVKGNDYYSDSEIIKVSGLKKGQNLFRLNKFEIIDTLEQKLPYLKEVKIKRHLPVGIEITVTETEPYLCIDTGSGIYLADENLKVLEKTNVSKLGLASVTGIKFGSPKVGRTLTDKKKLSEHLAKVVPIFKEHFGDKVSEISITEVYDIRMVYDERVTVKFGTLENITEKAQLVKHTLDDNRGQEKAVIEFSKDNRLHYRALD